MGNVGWGEMLVIAVLGLLLFGPSKLPEMGRSLGTAIQEFKKAMNPGSTTDPTQAAAPPPLAPAPRRRAATRRSSRSKAKKR